MRLPSFEYLEPQSLSEASSMLAAHKGEARLVSGGTDLLVLMKQRVVTPPYVVNLKSVGGLSYIDYDGKKGLRIGPLTTLRTVASSPIVKEQFPILAEAADRVASPLIRNNATIGGNIALDNKCWYYNQSHDWRRGWAPCLKRGGDVCHVVKGGKRCFSVHCSDTVPALIALGAELDIVSSQGKRTLALEKFHTGVGETPNVLGPDEIISEIRVPKLPTGTRTAFIKLAFRASIDYGLVDVAVALTGEANDGRCKDAKIVVSAVGPGPVNASRAARTLIGQEIDEKTAEAAGQAALEEARHISSVWTSVAYRRKMIKMLVARAVSQAWSNA